jgi:hypothetical protein
MYLLIQNPGVAPVEGFTLLGVSTTRDCGVAGTIGQFGSGAKLAINTLLRAGLKLYIYCGKTKLEFATRDDVIDDGLVEKPVKRVTCKTGTNKPADTGWVLDFGAIDWTNVAMALREFVANAIDRTIREKGDFQDSVKNGDLSVSIVNDVRACAGYTRVCVELNEDVQRYYGELPRRFLHFSDRPEQVKQTLLPKASRNLSRRTAMVYREGVFVREIEERDEPSLFDFNFKAAQLAIDESRNSNEYAVRAAAARVLRTAQTAELIHIFQSLMRLEDTFEATLDPDYICSRWATPTDAEKQNWLTAWTAVAGDAVLCSSSTLAQFVERKGRKVVCIKSAGLVEVAGRFGIPTQTAVLTDLEQNGRELLPATPAAIEAVDTTWEWLEAYGLTNGKKKPAVGCFRQHMEGGAKVLGFCDETGVYISDDQSDGVNKLVLQTALEEVAHHASGATDGSRDFQMFLVKMLVEVLA